jgi:hypothetical protein
MTITRAGDKITWFLPKPWRWTDPTGRVWHDAGAERNRDGEYASNLPLDTPGIAFPNDKWTLSGWWEVRFPRLGKTVVARQIDIGAKKPVIDLSAPLAYAMFKSQDAMVDHTPWSATYLGINLPEGKSPGVAKD